MASKKSTLSGLTTEELLKKETDLRRELFGLKMQWKTGQLQDTSVLKKAKKDIARVKTYLGQKSV